MSEWNEAGAEAIEILQAAVGLPRTGSYDAVLHNAMKRAIQMEVARVVSPAQWGYCNEGWPRATIIGGCWADLLASDDVERATAPYLNMLERNGPGGLPDVGGMSRGVPGVPVPAYVFRSAQPMWEMWKIGPAGVAAAAIADAARREVAARVAAQAEVEAAAAQAEAARRAEIARIAAAHAANLVRIATTAATILEAQAAARAAAEAEVQSTEAAKQAVASAQRASTVRSAATAAGVPPTTAKSGVMRKVLAFAVGAVLVVGAVVVVGRKG